MQFASPFFDMMITRLLARVPGFFAFFAFYFSLRARVLCLLARLPVGGRESSILCLTTNLSA